MPAKLAELAKRKLEYQPEQEQAAPVALHPGLEADEAGPVEAGRPYQAFVESEARKYWQDMVNTGSLTKPDQQELRAAAMPILCKALRKRGGVRFLPPMVKAHMAVNAMHMRAAERGDITRQYNGPHPVADHLEAMIQYADDTRLLAREIPLPEHPDPQHPPICYYIDPVSKCPVPRADAFLRGEYVYKQDGSRTTEDEHIYPYVTPGEPNAEEMLVQGRWFCYTLDNRWETIQIIIHRVSIIDDLIVLWETPLKNLHFSPHPPVAGEQDA